VDFDYPVIFTRNALSPENPALSNVLRRREPDKQPRLVAVIDSGLALARPELSWLIQAYADHHGLILAEPAVVLPGGEVAKNGPQVVEACLSLMHRGKIDRHSYLLALGGGALLDAAGHAAAICHRGVRLVRLPSTVLAQNDSAVGVKNGVNAYGLKNFIGSFAPPWAVIADFRFLESLEPRDRRAGLAEAVKVAAIRDEPFLGWLEDHADALAAFEDAPSFEMIRRSAQLHLRHIAEGGDPFEMGSARPLDFGHWSAHKLESLTNHALRHGEAVAMGMALDTLYSAATGLLPKDDALELCHLIKRLGFRLYDPAMALRGGNGRRLLLAGLTEFQEHLGGQLTLTLLAARGQGIEVHEMDLKRLEGCITRLAAMDGPP